MEEPETMQPTWTIYPSLLASLKSQKQRDYLERAACAHLCGRFTESTSIFDSDLPPSHLVPILTLQKADMLTTQGLEHDRIKLLQQALAHGSKQDVSTPEHKLIELMLADAEYWAYGKLKNALDKARGIKKWLKNSTIKDLSDIAVCR
jgi:hypothetical protein